MAKCNTMHGTMETPPCESVNLTAIFFTFREQVCSDCPLTWTGRIGRSTYVPRAQRFESRDADTQKDAANQQNWKSRSQLPIE